MIDLKDSIKGLSDDGLYLVYQDAVQRVGSHVSGSDPVPEYIQQQESIMNMVQDELMGRRSSNEAKH